MDPERLDYVKKLINGEIQDKDMPNGFGLANVNQRLKLNYGAEYGLLMSSEDGEWTEISAIIPTVKN